MNDVDRAAEVIENAAAAIGQPDPDRVSTQFAARALADAGLLVSDADRAVLDAAADETAAEWKLCDAEGKADLVGIALHEAEVEHFREKRRAAVRARRETQP